jgi:hypothetical protein
MCDWAAAEGWNPGQEDAPAFHEADPDGFFIAERGGGPVASISVVNHDDGHAFLGLYICRPDWRGQGIGLSLWTHALAHAGNRSVGLDGVPAQQENYAKSGFRAAGATRRWEGRLSTGREPLVRVAIEADMASVAKLDASACGYSRPRFIGAWTRKTPTRRTVVLDGPDGLAGFATARICRSGCKIGPIVAPDAATALSLAGAAASEVGEQHVIIDVPHLNWDLTSRLEGMGFANPFTTARMFLGQAPVSGPLQQAIATMELG